MTRSTGHLLLGTGGLLLLVLVLLVAGRLVKRAAEDLEDLLVLNLLVRLELAEIGIGGGGELGDAVLGDGWRKISVNTNWDQEGKRRGSS